jgi:hypothetical protein
VTVEFDAQQVTHVLYSPVEHTPKAKAGERLKINSAAVRAKNRCMGVPDKTTSVACPNRGYKLASNEQAALKNASQALFRKPQVSVPGAKQ